MRKQSKIIGIGIIILLLAVLFTIPVFAFSLSDVGDFFGLGVATGSVSTTGVSIYDTYAEIIDFLIFTVLFVSVVHIALKKWFGEDYTKAGAGNAIRALTIVVGVALAIAALKAGLSVSFFVPFVKNLLFFLIMVALYFVFVRMGMKSKILAWILAVIVTLLLFTISDVMFNASKIGSKIKSPFGGIGLPDLGGPTKVISSGVSSIGDKISNFFGGIGDSIGITSSKSTSEKDKGKGGSGITNAMTVNEAMALMHCKIPSTAKTAKEKADYIQNKLLEIASYRDTFKELDTKETEDLLTKCRELYDKYLAEANVQYEQDISNKLKKCEDVANTPAEQKYNAYRQQVQDIKNYFASYPKENNAQNNKILSDCEKLMDSAWKEMGNTNNPPAVKEDPVKKDTTTNTDSENETNTEIISGMPNWSIYSILGVIVAVIALFAFTRRKKPKEIGKKVVDENQKTEESITKIGDLLNQKKKKIEELEK